MISKKDCKGVWILLLFWVVDIVNRSRKVKLGSTGGPFPRYFCTFLVSDMCENECVVISTG